MIIIGIIVSVLFYSKKHKELAEKVNQISFKESRAEDKNEGDKIEQLLIDNNNHSIN